MRNFSRARHLPLALDAVDGVAHVAKKEHESAISRESGRDRCVDAGDDPNVVVAWWRHLRDKSRVRKSVLLAAEHAILTEISLLLMVTGRPVPRESMRSCARTAHQVNRLTAQVYGSRLACSMSYALLMVSKLARRPAQPRETHEMEPEVLRHPQTHAGECPERACRKRAPSVSLDPAHQAFVSLPSLFKPNS